MAGMNPIVNIISTSSSNSSEDQCDSNKYKGVRKRKWGKWVSEIRLPNSRERIWLGSYDSPRKAARAFDAALYCLRGQNAHFNFPDTPSQLLEIIHNNTSNTNNNATHGQSLAHHEIQELAARFANHIPPPPPEQPYQSPSSSEPMTTTTVEDNSNKGIDWSFLNSLDSNMDDVDDAAHFRYDHIHLYPASPPPLFIDNTTSIPDANEGDDAFFHHSLCLWNF